MKKLLPIGSGSVPGSGFRGPGRRENRRCYAHPVAAALNQDGSNMKEQLEAADYEVELQYANNDITMEIFAGAPDDNNARIFYWGAYDVYAPYIESGKIVVPSGQIDFETVATQAWDSANIQARLDNLIAANYSDGIPPDAVLCSNDSTALG